MKGLALDVAHSIARSAIDGVAYTVDWNYAGVLQAARDLSFAAEARQSVLTVAVLGLDQFQGYLTA